LGRTPFFPSVVTNNGNTIIIRDTFVNPGKLACSVGIGSSRRGFCIPEQLLLSAMKREFSNSNNMCSAAKL
jgi:hypothetical protein